MKKQSVAEKPVACDEEATTPRWKKLFMDQALKEKKLANLKKKWDSYQKAR